MIPKMLLSLSDYESDMENLGVPPNEIGVPDSESDIALDITNQFMTDPRCPFLMMGGSSFAAQLREKGRLTDFYQAGWSRNCGYCELALVGGSVLSFVVLTCNLHFLMLDTLHALYIYTCIYMLAIYYVRG